MKRVIFTLFTGLLIIFSFSTTALGSDNTIISIDGDAVQFTELTGYPFVDDNNRTLVPFRKALESFGADVSWDNENSMAIAEYYGTVVKVPIGQKYILKDGKKITIDTVSIVNNSKTYLPIRPVIEAFGGLVSWDSYNNAVKIESGSSPQKIHYDSWENVANKALTQPQYKYGIYVSRSMAVKYPEMYLKGDRLVYEKLLSKTYGTKAYFENQTKDFVTRKALEKKVRETESLSKSLRWSDIDVKDYVKMDYREFYAGQPLLNFMDIRMYGLATALQPNNMKMTELNMAEILYFKEKDLEKNNPYILMSEDGNAYLWSDDRLMTHDGQDIDDISEKIVLIFSEDYVWYPLMERDDTDKNDALSNLVESYTNTDDNLPSLTKHEDKLVNILKESTDISASDESIKIQYYTSKIYTAYLRQNDFKDKKIFTVYDDKEDWMRELDTGFVYYVVAKNANYLSPVTAHYAGMARESKSQSLNNMTNVVIKDFHNKTQTGTINRSTISALNLWGQSELVYINIDDTWLTKSANCMYSASNASSVFELANIDDMEIVGVSIGYSDDPGGHIHLAMYKDKEMRMLENFHPHGEYDNGLISYNTGIFRGFVIEQDWVNIIDEITPNNMKIYTNRDKTWAIKTLEYIKERSQEKAVVVSDIEENTRFLKGVNIVEYLKNLNTDNIYNYQY